VKPANLFLCKGGPLKLLDFGLAVALGQAGELTRTRIAVGTPAYMAPEQAQGGRKEDPRTDVWGLGATLYTALTLRPPFAADSPAMVLLRIAGDPPDPLPPSVPPALRDAILRALDKDPGKRFQSMSRFASALRGEQAVEATPAPVVAAPRTPPPRTPPPRTPPPRTPPPEPPSPIEPDRTTTPLVTAAAVVIGIAVLLGIVLFGAIALRLASGEARGPEAAAVPPGFTRHDWEGFSFVASSALARDPAPPAGTMILLAGIGTEHVSLGMSPYPGDPATYIRQNTAQLPTAQIETVRLVDRPAGRDGFDMELVVRNGGQSMRLLGRTFVIGGNAYSLTCAALEPGFESLRGRCETTIGSLSAPDR
jgi:hypothetical protein